jgi:hypothetical protein
MEALWRTTAGRLLLGYLLLDVATSVYICTAGAHLNAGHDVAAQQVSWLAVDTVLLWLIWRAGRLGQVAWGILLGFLLISLIVLLAGMLTFTAYLAGIIVLVAIQAAILLAPAVRRHIRGQQHSA